MACAWLSSASKTASTVTAMKETLDRSNLGLLRRRQLDVNVERSMIMNGRLDGHIVQGARGWDGSVHQHGGCWRLHLFLLSNMILTRDGTSWIFHGRQRFCRWTEYRHCLRTYRRLVQGGYHPIYSRKHQFPWHHYRNGGQHRIWYSGKYIARLQSL